MPGSITGTFALDDKYVVMRGRALATGIQPLVTLTIDRRRVDIERGLDTREFASGHQGSPVGELDSKRARARRHLDDDGVVLRRA